MSDPGEMVFHDIHLIQPHYDCIRHPDTYVVTFSGDPSTNDKPVHICAKCWRDWCLAQGWEASIRRPK